jgi:hypothetical protein
MSDDAFQTVNRAAAQVSVTTAPRPASLAITEVASLSDALLRRRRAFRLTRHVVDFLLFLSLFVVAYAAVWEYSTRRYLKGFSEAIIPLSVSPEQKVQAILDWMSASGAQLTPGFVRQPSDRDPVDTLNYQALLKICGTATNAFINLADSGGLSARRLLLLNADQYAKHVDAEVLLNGRWVVVDPAFRRILRGSDGKTLTRDQLADPAVFAAATRNIRNYDPDYSFENTAHVRMARIEFVGAALQKALHSVVPAWENSATISLILERESLAATVIAVLIAVFLVLVRISLRWYGEKYLHIYSVRMRQQLRSAFQAFFSPAS